MVEKQSDAGTVVERMLMLELSIAKIFDEWAFGRRMVDMEGIEHNKFILNYTKRSLRVRILLKTWGIAG